LGEVVVPSPLAGKLVSLVIMAVAVAVVREALAVPLAGVLLRVDGQEILGMARLVGHVPLVRTQFAAMVVAVEVVVLSVVLQVVEHMVERVGLV
jgi:hypothetical protein